MSSPETGTVALVVDEIRETVSFGSCTGQVKWWSNARGYGFITLCSPSPDRGKDIFVHHTGIKPLNSNYKSLRKGEYVNFNLIDGPNGPQAVDVTGIGGGCLMCDIAPIRREPPYGAYSAAPPPPPARRF